jgi:hypothetical protein
MAATDMIVFDSLLHRSNLPVQEKSYLRRWVDNMTEGALAAVAPPMHLHRPPETRIEAGLSMLRQGSEGMAVGAICGALSAHDALDPLGVPVDGAGGVLMSVLGVWGAGHEAAKDARNAGSAGLTVFTFRKVDKLLRTVGSRMAGEDNPVPGTEDARTIDVDGDSICDFAKNNL